MSARSLASYVIITVRFGKKNVCDDISSSSFISLLTGIDNTVCTYGGLLSYDHSSGAETLNAPSGLSILLVDTRVSRNTRLLVEGVRQKKKMMPKVTNNGDSISNTHMFYSSYAF